MPEVEDRLSVIEQHLAIIASAFKDHGRIFRIEEDISSIKAETHQRLDVLTQNANVLAQSVSLVTQQVSTLCGELDKQKEVVATLRDSSLIRMGMKQIALGLFTILATGGTVALLLQAIWARLTP